MNTLLKIAITAAIEAGTAIIDVYQSDCFDIELKDDKSPLTRADKAAHDVITGFLRSTGLPVLSEEGRDIPYDERKQWSRFWLVDPLDGTKEFIKRNGEFTVNIALIENNLPVAGVIYVPVNRTLYFADNKNGAYKIENLSTDFKITEIEKLQPIKLPLNKNNNAYVVVASRSHLSDETKAFINKLSAKHKNVETISRGSSLKLCMVAEGKADIYPRFGPTMEWDTAAGHAIAVASGATVLRADNNEILCYNKNNLLNPWFIVETMRR